MLRGRLRARILSTYGEGILANSRNGLLIVDPKDFGVSRTLLNSGSYAWSEVEWLTRILGERSHVAFVGAHIGALLVPIALRARPRITAFEPSPRNHRLLTMNIALNGLDSIAVHRLAISDSEGTVRFTQNPINSGNSRISPHGEVEVQVCRLDSVLTQLPILDLLVMDTEGFEVRAMRGGSATLGKTNYFHVEYAPEQLLEQGSNPGEFIELVAHHFSSMYIRSAPVPPGRAISAPGDSLRRFFADRSYVRYLRELPQRRGLLMNLLFSNEPVARAELMS